MNLFFWKLADDLRHVRRKTMVSPVNSCRFPAVPHKTESLVRFLTHLLMVPIGRLRCLLCSFTMHANAISEDISIEYEYAGLNFGRIHPIIFRSRTFPSGRKYPYNNPLSGIFYCRCGSVFTVKFSAIDILDGLSIVFQPGVVATIHPCRHKKERKTPGE